MSCFRARVVLATLISTMPLVESASPVSVKVEAPESNLDPGEESAVRLVVSVESPWFIYAPTNNNVAHGMVEASIEMRVSDRVQFREAEFPEPSTASGYDVYSGNVNIIIQPFRVRTSATPGETVIRGRFEYQACKPDLCLPPERLGLRVRVNID